MRSVPPLSQHLAAERAKAEALTAELQSSVSEMRGAHTAEKARLLLEHERLQALSVAVQQERASLAAEAAAERRALEDARHSRESEGAKVLAELEVERANLRLAHESIARERERIARERAAETTAKAQAEAAVRAHSAELAAERSLLDDAKARVASEAAEVASARAALERERNAFAQDVEALKQLSIRVQEESAAVRDAAQHSSRQLAASRELATIAETERAAAEEAREAAEMASREVMETRRAFEAERLATAKERKEMAERKLELERTAEATRTLQLQISRHMGVESSKIVNGDKARLVGPPLAAAARHCVAYNAVPRGRPKPFAPPAYPRSAWQAHHASPAHALSGAIEEVGSPPRNTAYPDVSDVPQARSPALAQHEEPRLAQPAAGPAGTAASLVAAAGWRHAYDQCAEAIKASHTEILAKLRAPPPTSKVPALTIPPPSEENLQRATRHPPNPGCEAACRHSDVGLNPATTGTSTTRHSYHFPGMVPIDTPFPSHSSTPIGDRGREAGSTRPSNVSVFPGDPRCRTCVGTAAVTVPTGVESSGSSMVSLHKTRLSSWGSEASIPAHQVPSVTPLPPGLPES